MFRSVNKIIDFFKKKNSINKNERDQSVDGERNKDKIWDGTLFCCLISGDCWISQMVFSYVSTLKSTFKCKRGNLVQFFFSNQFFKTLKLNMVKTRPEIHYQRTYASILLKVNLEFGWHLQFVCASLLAKRNIKLVVWWVINGKKVKEKSGYMRIAWFLERDKCVYVFLCAKGKD